MVSQTLPYGAPAVTKHLRQMLSDQAGKVAFVANGQLYDSG